MADIDIVLERLVTDTAFRAALADDPAAALSGYDLSVQDVELLAGSLDDGDDAQRGVEQRTSKSAMVGLLASLTGGSGGSGGNSPKYTAPINVASGTTTIRTGDGAAVADQLTGRPVGQPQAAGLGSQVRDLAGKTTEMGDEATRLNAQPQGSVTVPIGSSRSGVTTDLPKLDATSKDTAYLNQAAPPDDPAGRLIGGGLKAGDFSVSRAPAADAGGDGSAAAVDNWFKASSNRAGENVAPAGSDPAQDGAGRFRDDPYAEDASRLVDRPRPGEISVTRAPAGDIDGDGAADRVGKKWIPGRADEDMAPAGFDAKRSEAEVNLDALRQTPALSDSDIAGRNAAPPADPQWDSSGDRGHTVKYEPDLRQDAPRAADYDADTERAPAPVPADYDGDGTADITTQASWQSSPVGRAGGIDDDCDGFLTVEDE